jgi:hypothetical protein
VFTAFFVSAPKELSIGGFMYSFKKFGFLLALAVLPFFSNLSAGEGVGVASSNSNLIADHGGHGGGGGGGAHFSGGGGHFSGGGGHFNGGGGRNWHGGGRNFGRNWDGDGGWRGYSYGYPYYYDYGYPYYYNNYYYGYPSYYSTPYYYDDSGASFYFGG